MSEEKTPQELLQETQGVTPVTPVFDDMIFGIETVDDIFKILQKDPEFSDWDAFGHVTVKSEGDYLLFNYGALATYEGTWNAFERMSRGLIIDKKWHKVVARPFDKFFNWGQHGWTTEASIEYVMQKMDGSLGVCWFDANLKTWRITTRGGFDSDQAKWATAYLHRQHGALIERHFSLSHTYLFEIVYPENRIVVDYGTFKGLVLIGVRSNDVGGYYTQHMLRNLAASIMCPVTRFYDSITDPSLILESLKIIKGVENEGFITVHKDGTRWKFKGEDYLKIHKVISTFSFKHVLKSLSDGTFTQWIESIPDEFLSDIKKMATEILATVDIVETTVERAYDHCTQIVKAETYSDYADTVKNYRKLFAQTVQRKYPKLAPFLFRKLDGKFDREFIFKKYDFSELEDNLNG